MDSARTYRQNDARMVCYLSAESLLGPHLANNLLNLGIETQARQGMEELGLSVQTILDEEAEPVSETADSGGWLLAIWTRCLRWKFQLSDSACVTSTAFSIR